MTADPAPSLSADLLARLAADPTNEEAWASLYQTMWPFMLGVVYRRLRGAEGLAEDAAQEVFVRLARAHPFDRFRDTDAFRGYVWRVADNVARTYARRLLGRRATEVAVPEAAIEDAAMVESPRTSSAEDEFATGQLRDKLLGELDRNDLEIVRLLLAGRTLSEIASAVGLTYSNAGVRLHRLRRRLRKYLFEKESVAPTSKA